LSEINKDKIDAQKADRIVGRGYKQSTAAGAQYSWLRKKEPKKDKGQNGTKYKN